MECLIHYDDGYYILIKDIKDAYCDICGDRIDRGIKIEICMGYYKRIYLLCRKCMKKFIEAFRERSLLLHR